MLREILRVIATEPNPEACVLRILELAHLALQSKNISLFSIEDPEMLVSVGDVEFSEQQVTRLKLLADEIGAGVHQNPIIPNGMPTPAGTYFLASVPVGGRMDAVLWLDCGTQRDAVDGLVEALVDGLSIALSSARRVEESEVANHLTWSLITGISDPLLVLDDSFIVRMANPAVEGVFGVTPASAQGKPLDAVVQDAELVKLARGEIGSLEEWITEDGRTFVPHREVVRDRKGNPEGWVMILRDVTHFRKLYLNQVEFTRIVSHDLRSPLTSMQGFASMLESGMVGELNEKQGYFVEKILSGITQITALVDNIQDAGRYDPETGFYEMQRSHIDIGEIVDRVTNSQLVPAEKQALKISTSIAPNVPIINADGTMLERATINLVDNAIKYTPDGGEILVKVERVDDTVRVSVSDTGPGINAEDQQHLFERHVRLAKKEHKKVKGSGLGLFIVRSVAQRHDGDAWVESEPGKGSTFFYSIPLAGKNLIIFHE